MLSEDVETDGHRAASLLEVRDLRTHIRTQRGIIKAVDGVSFALHEGETLGLVGELGSGKSTVCLSIVRLVGPKNTYSMSGEIRFKGEDLLCKSADEMRRLRGAEIGMIFQDPMSALNPAFTIGDQVAEPLWIHGNASRGTLRQRAVELLSQVHIADPEQRVRAYPHQISGGMRQRVAGAIAISCKPSLLIADEPTTSLDVTIQTQYLLLLKEVQAATNLGLIFVTHDLGIVVRICERVAVMYAGRIVESGLTREIFDRPLHPYTRALLDCLPENGIVRRRLITIAGDPPDLGALPPGCPFAPRCPLAQARCREAMPPEIQILPERFASCWRSEDLLASGGRSNGAEA